MSVENPITMTRATAEEFIYDEVAALDEGRLREWLALFTEDAIYWMPSNELEHDPDRHVSLIYDTREQLAERIRRFELGRVLREKAPRLLHLVSNVRLTPTPPPARSADINEVHISASMVIHEVQGGLSSIYPAQCRYVLRSGTKGWRIARKSVALLNNDQYLPNLTCLY